MRNRSKRSRLAARSHWLLIVGLLSGLILPAQAQVPTILTDKVYKGDGIIDLMKDVSGDQLQSTQTDDSCLVSTSTKMLLETNRRHLWVWPLSRSNC
jgi:hypothetical protein